MASHSVRHSVRPSCASQIAISAALALCALAAAGQLRRIREYHLHESEDKAAAFAMTLGPDNTLYTLLPRRDGNWILSRIQSWWLDHPDELGIVVEGFSVRDPIASLGQMDLAVTPDGKYLVAVLSAPMRVATNDSYPMDMIVEVVRLDTFQVVDTEHMRSLGMRGNLLGTLDRAGHLLVDSSIPSTGPDAAATPYVTWFRVALPVLKPELMCSYQTAGPKDTRPLEEACAAFAKTEGYASAAEVAASLPHPTQPANPAQPPPGIAIPPKEHYQAQTVTIDGKPLTLVVLNGVEVEVYAAE
ncbi:MAG TPA: hypothetical protein VMD92_03630 [Acidobacteriaceae bacterium]|nr:hypothetical protein [Acidobacteriaceae bacterium]